MRVVFKEMKEMPTKFAGELEELMIRTLRATGVAPSISERVARHLVGSNLVGVDSHGLIQFPDYLESVKQGKIAKDNQIEVIRDHGAIALLDGHLTFGMVVVDQAIDMGISKARKFGASVVSARNSAHIGRLGEYAEDIARQSLIGFICNSSQGMGQGVAPWGGREIRLSTNPLAWGIPSESDPIIFDMSTSSVAAGKIQLKLHRGETLPTSWEINTAGTPVTDPADFHNPRLGAMLLAAGYKGYGLALVVEALAGVLSGGGCVWPEAPLIGSGYAFTLLVIDVAAFCPIAKFTKEVDNFITYVKSATPLDIAEAVRIPGKLSPVKRQQRLTEGISIEDETWNRLVEAARSVGIEVE